MKGSPPPAGRGSDGAVPLPPPHAAVPLRNIASAHRVRPASSRWLMAGAEYTDRRGGASLADWNYRAAPVVKNRDNGSSGRSVVHDQGGSRARQVAGRSERNPEHVVTRGGWVQRRRGRGD